jgi:hypothetical protein
MLNLVRLNGINQECHLVAGVLGLVGTLLFYFLLSDASIGHAIVTGIICAVCWYIYKLGEGLTFDGQPTIAGPVVSIGLIVLIMVLHFTTI